MSYPSKLLLMFLLAYCSLIQSSTAQTCSNGIIVDPSHDFSKANQDQDGNFMVYESSDGNDMEIFLHDVSTNTTTQISNNTLFDRNAKISGDYIVWEQLSANNDDEVVLYRISTNGPIINISNRTGNEDDPLIDGNFVVWEGFDGTDTDIYLYDIANDLVVNITNDATSDFDPKISDNHVVWRKGDNLLLYDVNDAPVMGNFITINNGLAVFISQYSIDGDHVVWTTQDNMTFAGDIYLYSISNGGAPNNISNSPEDDQRPVINGDLVAWFRSDGTADILAFRISTSASFVIQSNDFNQDEIAIDGDIVVFSRNTDCNESDVFYYNVANNFLGLVSNCPSTNDYGITISSSVVAWSANNSIDPVDLKYYTIPGSVNTCIAGTNISQNPSFPDRKPETNGRYVIWEGEDGSDTDIFMYDTLTQMTINVSNNSSNYDRNARISGDYIVWEHSNDSFDDEILLYRISTNGPVINISNRPGNEDDPIIDGNYVVWEGFDGTDTDVYLYDIMNATLTDVTNDTDSQFDPDIDDGRIVWYVSNIGGQDLFLYEIGQAPIPANFQNISNGISSTISNHGIDSIYVYWEGSDPVNFDVDIYIYKIGGVGPLQISDNPDNDFELTYNKGRLLWVEQYTNNDNELALYDLESMTKTIITNDNFNVSGPIFSGDYVFFQQGECDQSEIFVLRISDGSLLNLSNCPFNIIGLMASNGAYLYAEVSSSNERNSEIISFPIAQIFPTRPVDIPSMGFWALISLGLVSLIFGVNAIHQKRIQF